MACTNEDGGDGLSMMEESVSVSRYEIASLLALLNMLKANLMEKDEVYKTLLAVLCDYNPQQPGSWEWAKRYISLLVNDKVLANCLLMSMPHPAPIQLAVAPSIPTTPLQMLAKHHLRKKRLFRGKPTPPLVKSLRALKTVHRSSVDKENIASKFRSPFESTVANETTDDSQATSSTMDQPLDYRKPFKESLVNTCSSATKVKTNSTNLPVNNAFATLAQMHNYSQWMQNETLHLFQNPAQNIIQANMISPPVNVLRLPVTCPDPPQQQLPQTSVQPPLQTATSPWQPMTSIDKLAYVASQSLNSSHVTMPTLPNVPIQVLTSSQQAFLGAPGEALNLTQQAADNGQHIGNVQTNKGQMTKGHQDEYLHHGRSQSESDNFTSGVPRLLKRKSDLKLGHFTKLPTPKPKQVKLGDESNENKLKSYSDYENRLNDACGSRPDSTKIMRNSLQALAELTASIGSENNQKKKSICTSGMANISMIPPILSLARIVTSNTCLPDSDAKSNPRKGLKTFPYSQKIRLPNGQTSTLNFEGNSVALTNLQPSTSWHANSASADSHDNSEQVTADKERNDVEFPVITSCSNEHLSFSNQNVMKQQGDTLQTGSVYGSKEQACQSMSGENISNRKSEICISYSRGGGIVISQPVLHYTNPICRPFSDTGLPHIATHDINPQVQNSECKSDKETNIGSIDDDNTCTTREENDNVFVSEPVSTGSITTGMVNFPFMIGSQKHVRSSSVSTCVLTANQMSQTPEYTHPAPEYRMRSRSDSEICQAPSSSQQDQNENSSTGQSSDGIEPTNTVAQTPSFIPTASADNTEKSLKLQTKGNQLKFKNSSLRNIAPADSPLLRARLSTDENTKQKQKPHPTTLAVSNAQDMASLKQLENVVAADNNTVCFFLKDNGQRTKTSASLSITSLPTFCNTGTLRSLSNSELSTEPKPFSEHLPAHGSANKVSASSVNNDSTIGRSFNQNKKNAIASGRTNTEAVDVEVAQLAKTSAATCKSVPGISAINSVPEISSNVLASYSMAMTVPMKHSLAKPMITTIGCNDGNMVGNTELEKYKRHILHNDVRVRNTRFLSDPCVKPCRVVGVGQSGDKVTKVEPSSESSQEGLPEVDDIADEVFLEEFISQNVKKFTRKAVAAVKPQSHQS